MNRDYGSTLHITVNWNMGVRTVLKAGTKPLDVSKAKGDSDHKYVLNVSTREELSQCNVERNGRDAQVGPHAGPPPLTRYFLLQNAGTLNAHSPTTL